MVKPSDHVALLDKLRTGAKLTAADRAELDRVAVEGELVFRAVAMSRSDARESAPRDYDEETLADGSVVIFPHADHKKGRRR